MLKNTKYSFWWTPKPVTGRRSTRAQKGSPTIEPYRNVMYDKRVIRGSNYGATSIELDVYKAAEWRRRNVLRKKVSQRNQRNVLGTPPPVRGRCHEIIQTEKYLEELLEHPPQRTIDTQTDLFLEPPPSPPPYIPSKIGIDVGTSIDPGDLEPISENQKEDDVIEQFVANCLLDAAREMELEMIFSFSETTEQPEPESIIDNYVRKKSPHEPAIKTSNEIDDEASEEVAKIVDLDEILVTIINEIVKQHSEAKTEQSESETELPLDEENKLGITNKIQYEHEIKSSINKKSQHAPDIDGDINMNNNETYEEVTIIVDVAEIFATIIDRIVKQHATTEQCIIETQMNGKIGDINMDINETFEEVAIIVDTAEIFATIVDRIVKHHATTEQCIIETKMNGKILHDKERDAINWNDIEISKVVKQIINTEEILEKIIEEIVELHSERNTCRSELSESIIENPSDERIQHDTTHQQSNELTSTKEKNHLEAERCSILRDDEAYEEFDARETFETIVNDIIKQSFDESNANEENIGKCISSKDDEGSNEVANIVNAEEIFVTIIDEIVKQPSSDHDELAQIINTEEILEKIIEEILKRYADLPELSKSKIGNPTNESKKLDAMEQQETDIIAETLANERRHIEANGHSDEASEGISKVVDKIVVKILNDIFKQHDKAHKATDDEITESLERCKSDDSS